MTTERIDVALGARSYPVWIGAGLLARPGAWATALTGNPLLVVTDDNVGPLYGRALADALPGRRLQMVTVAAGEQTKTLAECAQLFAALAGLGAGRGATVVALGGGVVGDLAGFAAACWMRGIAHVQVPTTLLAMVDSAVGGKTAVNLPEGKNLVGAFHQPAAVVADIDTLATLPAREFAAGLAEVVKYGALGDAAFFDWLEANADALLRHEPAALVHAIATSVRHKAGIVARDEHEAGERALLNFGHTFGHAIETATGYDRYRHGEAVAIGMVQAARLSARLGLAPAADGDRLARLLARFGLPVALDPPIEPQRLLGHMRLDKKATGAGLRFVLWHGIGRAHLVDGVADADILAALADPR
jgi:3-dehydroquinate synthase